jgi:hypothetical protein
LGWPEPQQNQGLAGIGVHVQRNIRQNSSVVGKYKYAPLLLGHAGRRLLRVLGRAAARHQADDSHNDRQHKQKVDQTPCNVKSPPKKPKNEQDRKNGPEHGNLLTAARITGREL